MNNVKPFQLPLDREQFQAALRKGHGRAPMHVARFGAHGLEDLICDACTSALAYDAQCEDSRAPWLIKMIDSAGIEEPVVSKILQSMHREFDEKEFWDKKQLCGLAYQFAVRGRDDARKALYASLSRNDHSADIFAADEIIQLDEGDGLLFVAERVGRWLTDAPESTSDNFIVQFFDEAHGEGSAERILRSAAEHNEYVDCFLRHLHREEESEYTSEQRTKGTIIPDNLMRFGSSRPDRFEFMRHWRAQDLIREIREVEPSDNSHRNLYRRWAIKADEVEKRLIIEALFEECDPNRQFFYLHVFQDCGLPEFDGRFLDLFEKLGHEQKWLVSRILAKHEHPDVRNFALARIRVGNIGDGELRILTKNYHVGDWETIMPALKLSDDANEMHDLFRDIIELYKANAMPEASEPMMLAYEHSPCSGCRSNAVKVLISIKGLPDWVDEECNYDADRTTRELAAG